MSAKFKKYPVYTYDEPKVYSDFSGGINTEPSQEHLTESEIRDSVNMTYNSGTLVKRLGFEELAKIKCDTELTNIQGIFLFSYKDAYLIIAANGRLYAGLYKESEINLSYLPIDATVDGTIFTHDPLNVIADLEIRTTDKTGKHSGYVLHPENSEKYELIFQNKDSIESATYNNQLFITTGTRFIEVFVDNGNLTARIIKPYEINSTEYTKIGYNKLSPYPEYCLKSTYTAAMTSISFVLTKKLRTGKYLLQPYMTFAEGESEKDYYFKWEKLYEGKWYTYISFKDNIDTATGEKLNYYTIIVPDADKFTYRVTFTKAFEIDTSAHLSAKADTWQTNKDYVKGDLVSVENEEGGYLTYKCSRAHNPSKIAWTDEEVKIDSFGIISAESSNSKIFNITSTPLDAEDTKASVGYDTTIESGTSGYVNKYKGSSNEPWITTFLNTLSGYSTGYYRGIKDVIYKNPETPAITKFRASTNRKDIKTYTWDFRLRSKSESSISLYNSGYYYFYKKTSGDGKIYWEYSSGTELKDDFTFIGHASVLASSTYTIPGKIKYWEPANKEKALSRRVVETGIGTFAYITTEDTDWIIDELDYFGSASSILFDNNLDVDDTFKTIQSCKKIVADGNKFLLYDDAYNSGQWFKTIISNPTYITDRGGLSFKTSKNEALIKVIPYNGALIAFANNEYLGGSIHYIEGSGDDYEDNYYSPYRRTTVSTTISCDNANSVQVCENLLIFKSGSSMYYIAPSSSELSNEFVYLYSLNDRTKAENNEVAIPWDDNNCYSEVTEDYYALVWNAKYSDTNPEILIHPAMRLKCYYKQSMTINRTYYYPWLRDISDCFNIQGTIRINGTQVYLKDNTLIYPKGYTDLGESYTCKVSFRPENLGYDKFNKIINNVIFSFAKADASDMTLIISGQNESGYKLFEDTISNNLQSSKALISGNPIDNSTKIGNIQNDSIVVIPKYSFPLMLICTTIEVTSKSPFSISSIGYVYTTAELPDTSPLSIYSNSLRKHLLPKIPPRQILNKDIYTDSNIKQSNIEEALHLLESNDLIKSANTWRELAASSKTIEDALKQISDDLYKYK